MKTKSVCNQGTVKCTQGSAPGPLQVTSQVIVHLNGKKLATVADIAPSTNIPVLGTCRVLTAAALGTPTNCSPAPAGPWRGPSNGLHVDGLEILTDKHTCTCSLGGLISIDDSGNDVEHVD